MKADFKTFNVNDCILQNTRIDIWQYPLHTEFPEAKSLLNGEELTRAQRYHFDRHRRRFIVARAMLRLILARYGTEPANTLEFGQNKQGKPHLLNLSKLQFNLSHSGDMALLAVGCDHPMGIDLEFFSARPYEGIGSHMFSPAENMALENTQDALKPLAFFHIWAQKEALIKACGLGLSYPTQQFNVPALPSTRQPIFDVLHQQFWQMVTFHPQSACCGALCYRPEVTEIRYIKLPAGNSLQD